MKSLNKMVLSDGKEIALSAGRILFKQEGSYLILYLLFFLGFNLALIPAVRLNSQRGDKLKNGILTRFYFFF